MSQNIPDRLFAFFADTKAVPRDLDLLPPDAPVKTYAVRAVRANPWLRLLVFVATLFVVEQLCSVVIYLVTRSWTFSLLQVASAQLFSTSSPTSS